MPDPVSRLAVLGDSDSESYAHQRGGRHAAKTLQWTEVLAQLRPRQLDLGAWGSWGMPGTLTRWQRQMGGSLWWRGPRKYDNEFNFAISGAKCEDLMAAGRQARFLDDLVSRDVAGWAHGIVVIRIGGNDFAKPNSMDRLARDPNDGEVQGKVTACLAAIHDAVALLHARQPQLRVVLVGVFNPVHWAAYLDRWRSPQAVEHIDQGLDRFDNALRAFARADPRLAFFDDRDWFRQLWGGRDAQGQPAYKPVRLNARMEIRNTVGDAPSNAALEDGHCGAVWNGLWARALIKLLNDRFGLAIPPIEEPDLVQLLLPELVP